MGGDEVRRRVVVRAEGDEIADPRIGRGRGPPDLQVRVDRFDRFGGGFIELEIVVLRPVAEGVQIRLVPDLEEPLPHLRQAVTLNPMRDELADQQRPVRIVFRRADVGAVVEHRLVPRRQGAGHEAQFDKRPHADRQQKIKNLIGVEERIEQRLAFGGQGAHVIAQQAVKAHMAKAQFMVRAPHLRLPVGAQCDGRVVAADGMFPKVRQRRGRRGKVALEIGGRSSVFRRGFGRIAHGLDASWRTISSAISAGFAPTSTVIGCSSGVGASRLANWLSSRLTGMKCP